MTMLRAPLLMIGLLLCSQSFATTPQQEKMTVCNADATAKSLKGDERKMFMSNCLKTEPAVPDCNADATGKLLKGDERKAFMSECLRNK